MSFEDFWTDGQSTILKVQLELHVGEPKSSLNLSILDNVAIYIKNIFYSNNKNVGNLNHRVKYFITA